MRRDTNQILDHSLRHKCRAWSMTASQPMSCCLCLDAMVKTFFVATGSSKISWFLNVSYQSKSHVLHMPCQLQNHMHLNVKFSSRCIFYNDLMQISHPFIAHIIWTHVCRCRPRKTAAFLKRVHSYSGMLDNKPINDLALWLYVYKDEGLTVPVAVMAMVAVATNLPKTWFGGRLRVGLAYNFSNHYIGESRLPMQGMHPKLCSGFACV